MLQRAASNAYSWWWASNIRTNQSKWLDNNLQEMEDRVKAMLKIIEEDADSFAKRAEMYYKKRPELISHVEETYRAYRAIAERYDRISGELHKANHTLATAFPDVQFPMEDEDDDCSPKVLPSVDSIIQKMPPEVPEISLSKPPAEVPKISLISKKSENKSAPKNSQPIPALKELQSGSVSRQMSEDEAKEAINRLQKGILILQTEKEFIKSSYESGVAKYWEIENKITEMQEEVCFLEDEYNVNAVIEDDEARALMAVTALKSCKDTLVNLQEQRKRSKEETRVESERIRIAKEKLKALKSQRGQGEKEIGGISDEDTGTSPLTMTQEEASDLEQESLELQSICEKVNDHFEINSDVSVVDLAEKIDELVNKVISLELTVSSQTAQIQSLRSETDDLHKHLRSLEEDKSNLIDDSNSLSGRLKQAEEELHKIQNLEKRLKSEKSRLRIVFTEACQSLSDISEKLQSPRPNDQVKTAEELKSPKHQDQVKIVGPFPSQEEDRSLLNMEPQKESVVKNTMKMQDINDTVEDKTLCNNCQENQVQSDPVRQLENDSRKCEPHKQQDELREQDSPEANGSNHLSTDPETQHGEEEDAPNLQQLLLEGLEGREKILLVEYTSILQTYKDTKRKLLEVEKKNQEYFSETMSQVRELKSANAIKDDEINTLRQILNCLQTGSNLKRQSEMLEDLNVKGTSKSDASSGIQDRGNLNAEEDITLYRASEPHTTSAIEEKFRRDIDTLLDENLEFWLRFSTSFHQIQRFRTEFQNLQDEIEKLKDSKMQEASNSATEKAGKPESTPIEKQLRELKTELQVWVEQNALLRGELQGRFSSLCNIQEEISGVLKESSKSGEVQFTQYQAAKFQGEVLNMQQENNKVADELQSGLDHVKGLQVEVEKTFSKLHEKFELSASKRSSHQSNQFRHFATKTRGVPLRSFLYGVKPKKPSIFSCMSPALQKQYSDLRAGMPI